MFTPVKSLQWCRDSISVSIPDFTSPLNYARLLIVSDLNGYYGKASVSGYGDGLELKETGFATRSGQCRDFLHWRSREQVVNSTTTPLNITFCCNICVHCPKNLGYHKRKNLGFHLNFRFLSLLLELKIAKHLFKTYNLVYIRFVILKLKMIWKFRQQSENLRYKLS